MVTVHIDQISLYTDMITDLNPFDSFMYAIKLNAYSDLLRLKNLANQEEYAKLNIKSREPKRPDSEALRLLSLVILRERSSGRATALPITSKAGKTISTMSPSIGNVLAAK